MGVLSVRFKEDPVFKFYIADKETGLPYHLEAQSWGQAQQICDDEGYNLQGIKMDDNFDMFFGQYYQHIIGKN